MDALSCKEADLIGNAMLVTKDRFEDFSMSEHLLLDSLTIAHKKPGLQPDMTGFVKPFDPLVRLGWGAGGGGMEA